MSCNTSATTTTHFLPNRVTSPPSSSSSSRRMISFATRTGFTLKTRATLKDGGTYVTNPVAGTQMMSLYDLLNIPETGSLPEIKHAYKQLARRYHPDVSPPDRVKENTDRFIRVQEAYETLSDPTRRAVYDLQLSYTLQFSFSTRNTTTTVYPCNEARVEKSVWSSNSNSNSKWQSQVSEAKKRSMHKSARANTSSGAARMRRQRNDEF